MMAEYPLYVLHGLQSTSWFGPYGTADDARVAAERIATRGCSLGVRERTMIGRARYSTDGIEFAPLAAPRKRRAAY